MKKISLEILKKGDEVLNVYDDKIVVKHSNGKVEIFKIIFEKDGMVSIDDTECIITYGDREVEITNDDVTLSSF
ncbi:hypothetical protein NO1_0341 [Candidatus Termititenax aidoneus]|uniref:Uncharacterized protein n=1 Tax=Termititenax aidoneus TaxID=2218524 RepID=A0A388T9K0_TERA1|nr:hypothetical protein NO1_0341 [Candidatus Termititenax aidoneus]